MEKELNELLKKVCWNQEENYYDLLGLVFDKSVIISDMKVNGCLYQDNQQVKEILFQNNQNVGDILFQDNQKVKGNLYQSHQQVKGVLYQDEPKKEEHKEILDNVEKKYLWNIIKPFKNDVSYILKCGYWLHTDKEMITICIKDYTDMFFPLFKKGTMYKNMESGVRYSLKELGLFKETK